MLTISFHSPKGGSGATTTLVNTLKFLAKHVQATSTNPILVVDADLSTSSLTYLLQQENRFFQAYDVKSLLEGVIPGKTKQEDITNHPFVSKCAKIGERFGLAEDSIYFLGIDDLKDYDLEDSPRSVDKVLYELKRLCKSLGFSSLIFDLDPGDEFLSNFITRISKVIVMPLRVSKHSIMGTRRALNRFESVMVDLDSEDQLRQLIVLPNATPRLDEVWDDIRVYDASLALLKEQLNDVPYTINQDFVSKERFGIGELDCLKWQEGALFEGSSTKTKEEALALERYDQLAQAIVSEGDKW